MCQNRREIRVSCHDSFDLSGFFLARSRKGLRDLSPKVVINANTVVFEGGEFLVRGVVWRTASVNRDGNSVMNGVEN